MSQSSMPPEGEYPEPPLHKSVFKSISRWLANIDGLAMYAIQMFYLFVLIAVTVFAFENIPNNRQQPVTIDQQSAGPTTDDALAAIFRAYIFQEVCVGDNGSYFAYLNSENNDDAGWYYLANIKFNYLEANHTWYIKNEPLTFVKAWPNVTNLTCEKENKFKDK